MDNRVLPYIVLCLIILTGLMTLGFPAHDKAQAEDPIDLPDTPTIEIHDQPVMNRKIVIDEIHSGDQGWIAIYADQNGMPGRVIGYQHIIPGIFKQLEIEIDLSEATVVLYAMVHKDHGNIGIFEYPGIDLPVKAGDLAEPQSFRINYPFHS